MSALYGGAARLRRTWYERRPERRLRLDRPVVSVGNLVVGGSGKTPAVACLARLLRQAGERPAILSRGYRRRGAARDVVVVSDGARVLADVHQSGDEPQVLARALPGVPVLVSSDRYRAGRLAADTFDVTVFLLDDGFQHVRLARDVDLLIVAPEDLDEPVIPAGRLREPIDAGRGADALIVAGDCHGARGAISDALGVRDVFCLEVRYAAVRPLAGGEEGGGRRAIAVAGIARPQRFFAALRGQGWTVAREIAYRDHHWFTGSDVERIEDAARGLDVDAIVTTEKDAVRLEALVDPRGRGAGRAAWCVLPMSVGIEPADAFAAWMSGRLAAARGA